jgi:hypothetical protein
MARSFDDASTQYLQQRDIGTTIDVPLSMSCWFNSDDLTIHQVLMATYFYDGVATGYEHHRLMIRGAEAGDPVAASTQTGGADYTDATTSTGYSTGTWHHAAGVWASSTSRAAYIDGGSKGTDTTSKSPSSAPNSLLIGSIENADGSSMLQYMSGIIAQATIWNAALTDAEVAVLAAGYSPILIRPQSLWAYWPLVARTSPEIDVVGGYDLTLYNTPTIADHPPVFWQAGLVLPPLEAIGVLGGLYRRRLIFAG